MINENALNADAQKRLDNLVELSSRRREWYQDQFLRVADRQSQQIALISSVAATIMAITTVLPIQVIEFWVNLSFLLLLISVMSGIVLSLWLVNFDKKILDEGRTEELSILDQLKDSTKRLISNLTATEYKKHQKTFTSEINKIVQFPERHKSEKKAMNFTYYLVLITFAGGILSLALAWFLRSCVH